MESFGRFRWPGNGSSLTPAAPDRSLRQRVFDSSNTPAGSSDEVVRKGVFGPPTQLAQSLRRLHRDDFAANHRDIASATFPATPRFGEVQRLVIPAEGGQWLRLRPTWRCDDVEALRKESQSIIGQETGSTPWGLSSSRASQAMRRGFGPRAARASVLATHARHDHANKGAPIVGTRLTELRPGRAIASGHRIPSVHRDADRASARETPRPRQHSDLGFGRGNQTAAPFQCNPASRFGEALVRREAPGAIPSPGAAPAASSGIRAIGERESARFGECGPGHHARNGRMRRPDSASALNATCTAATKQRFGAGCDLHPRRLEGASALDTTRTRRTEGASALDATRTRGDSKALRRWTRPARGERKALRRWMRPAPAPAYIACGVSQRTSQPRCFGIGLWRTVSSWLDWALRRSTKLAADHAPAFARSLSVPAPSNSFGCSGGAAEGRQV
jgi:hypothetical protein